MTNVLDADAQSQTNSKLVEPPSLPPESESIKVQFLASASAGWGKTTLPHELLLISVFRDNINAHFLRGKKHLEHLHAMSSEPQNSRSTCDASCVPSGF